MRTLLVRTNLQRALLLILITSKLFAAGHDLTPPTFGPTPYAMGIPAVTSNGEDLLTLWTTTIGSANHVFASVAERNAHVNTPVASLAIPDSSIISVFPAANEFIALIRQGDQLREAVLTSTGRVSDLGAPVRIPLLNYPRVAFNGNRFVIVDIDYTKGLVGAHSFDRLGNLIQNVFWPYKGLYDVVATGRDFTVFGIDHGGVFMQRFTPELAPLTGIIRLAPQSAGIIAAASSPSGYAIAFEQRFAGMLRSTVTTLTIAPDGTVIGSSQFDTALVSRLTMLWTGRQYVLVGQTNESGFATRVDAAGKALDGAAPIAAGVSAANIGDEILSLGATAAVATFIDTATGIRTIRTDDLTTMLRRQTTPLLASDGIGFLALWSDQTRTATILSMLQADLGALNQPISGSAFNSDFALQSPASVAYGGSMFLAVWNRGQDILARRIIGGIPEPTTILVARGSISDQAVAWDGHEFFVVYLSAIGGISGSTVSVSGSASAPIPLAQQTLPWLPPKVFWDGSQFIVGFIWMRSSLLQINLPGGTAFFRVGADLNSLENPVLIGNRAVRFHFALGAPASVVAFDRKNDNEVPYDTVVTRVVADSSGIRTGSEATLFRWPSDTASNIAWDGLGYVVAWRYAMNGQWRIATERLPADAPPERARGVQAQSADALSAPAIASNGMSDTLVAVSEVAPGTSAARIRLYENRDLTELPAPPNAPRGLSMIGSPSGSMVEWERVNGEVAGYVIESAGTFPHMLATVPANQLKTAVSGTTAVRVRAFNAGGLSDPSTTMNLQPAPRRRTVSK
jgi:hypothetical protein